MPNPKGQKRKILLVVPNDLDLTDEALMSHLELALKQFGKFIMKSWKVSGWMRTCRICNNRFYVDGKRTYLCESCRDNQKIQSAAKPKVKAVTPDIQISNLYNNINRDKGGFFKK